jgi:membrane-associated phospholipid phosphatase
VQPTDGDGDSSAVATTVVRAWQGVPRAASLSHGVSRLAAIDLALLRVLRTRCHGQALESAAMVRTLVAAEVVNALVKLAIDRPRPRLAGLPPLMSTGSGRSCPSAHATTSFAAGRLLSQLLPGRAPYVAAVAMALTRPHTGVHYPSDVLAGMALGTVLGQIGRR